MATTEITARVDITTNDFMARTVRDLSRWIDTQNLAQGRELEALTWGRLAKLQEEAGEVIAAYIGVTGQNPRKGVTHQRGDVIKELADVVITGLAAIEHMTGNQGKSMQVVLANLLRVKGRADEAERAALEATR
jgi:NTP pyrophosphatase (non-canonical NTP hydrolase)